MSAHSRPRECGLTTLRVRTRSNKPDRNKRHDTDIAYTKTIIFFKNIGIVHKIITIFAAQANLKKHNNGRTKPHL